MILGLQDPCIAAAYLLSIGGSLVCITYGILYWNRDDEPARLEDVQWAKEEKEEIEQAL